MPVPVGTVFDTQKYAIQEMISKSVETFAGAIDPVWRETRLSSEGVGPTDALGRDMEIRKNYTNAVGGVIESAGPRGNFTSFGDTGGASYGSVLQTIGITQNLPDVSDDPTAVPIPLRIPMRGIHIAKKVTAGEMQLDALSSHIGSITTPSMMAWTRNIARRICSSWYTSQQDNYRLSDLGPNTGSGAFTVDNVNKKIKFYPPNKAVKRFAVGDRLDIMRDYSAIPVRMNDSAVTAGGVVSGDAAGQTFATRYACWVTAVNPLERWVEISFDANTPGAKFTTTGSLTTTQLGNNASYIVWANSTIGGAAFTDIPGFHSWAKFGGSTNAQNQLLGAEAVGTAGNGLIDIRTHPIFQSARYDCQGQALTEHRLNQFLDNVVEAFEDDGHFIDTIVTTQGVIRAAAAALQAREILDRTGNLSSLAKQGEDGMGMVHMHNGRTYDFRTSRWVSKGEVLGYRRTNNWVRYVPPATPQSQSLSGVEPGLPVELLIPTITGVNTIRWPILKNGQLTEASQIQGHLRMVPVPEKQVRMMKIVNCAEDTVSVTLES